MKGLEQEGEWSDLHCQTVAAVQRTDCGGTGVEVGAAVARLPNQSWREMVADQVREAVVSQVEMRVFEGIGGKGRVLLAAADR